jgi:hypothetical protein
MSLLLRKAAAAILEDAAVLLDGLAVADEVRALAAKIRGEGGGDSAIPPEGASGG